VDLGAVRTYLGLECRILFVVRIVANSSEPSIQAETVCLSGETIGAEYSDNQPLVTVVTAVYNGQPHVTQCLESVLRQDYPNIEHIVIDGGSGDGTVEVLRRYEDRLALWKSEPDLGIYDAWNKGLREARGEWICFLGIDDEFLPGAISAYMVLAATNLQAEYLTSQVKVVDSSGYQRIMGGPWTWKQFSRWMCTAHAGSMHRRSLYQRLGTYDTSYRIVADYELLLRARDQLNTAYMPIITVIMKDGGVSRTRMALVEQARAKIAGGGRNRLLTTLELHFANAKYLLRPLRYAWGRMMAR
jgi:glycosyltransferase involved in cell wall biosynthesis